MAELLHYLDKMEYRPAPKPRGKVILKRRPESQETTTNKEESGRLLLEIVDKRPVSGFKRTIIKEFERIIGTVQEKKSRKEGELRRGPTDIYVEHFQESIEELEVPVATQADVDADVEPVSLDEFPKLAELEDRDHERLEEEEANEKEKETENENEEEKEEPAMPEEKSRKLEEAEPEDVEKPKQRGRPGKKKETEGPGKRKSKPI